MPLVASTLAAQLDEIFASMPSNPSLAAKQMAMAYDTYCRTGMAGVALPVLTGVEMSALENILAPTIMSPKAGSPMGIAGAWASGVQAYWLAPPVVFTAPPILGAASVMPGAGIVASALSAAFANQGNTSSSIANIMASVLDAATKTVLVVFTAPPPPTGPPPPVTVM